MLDAVKPNQETEEPYESSTSLLECSGYSAMPIVRDSNVEVWTIVERRLIVGIRTNIYLNLKVLVLLPKLHDLISEAN
jgi:hypothetical protein